MTDTPEPPKPSNEPAPAPPPPQSAPPPLATATQRPPWLPILVGVAVIALLVAGYFIWRTQFAGPGADAYTVEAYTPPTELISARERVPGYDAPDAAGPIAVQFGAGVTLNVTGRVSRGLGNDWYAVAWNERTVFVRTADTVAGSGAPPTMVVREEEPEEIEEKEKPDPFEEAEEVEEFPDTPVIAPSGTLDIGDVSWIREPTSRDFARHYPRGALDDERSGRVVLDCMIAGSGRLDCSVGSESPGGYGFGDAALGISRQLRVQSRLPDGSSAAGRHLRLPLSFQAG